MGVGAGRVRVQQRRSSPLPAPAHRLLRGSVALQQIRSVTLHDLQAGKAREQARDAAAGRLHLDGDRNRVFVVLDDEQDGQVKVARRVQGLPELAFRGGSVAGGADDDLVVGERGDVLAELRGRTRPQAGFGGAHRLEELGAGRRRGRDDVEPGVAEVRGHLAAAARGIGLGAHSLKELLHGRHPQREGQRAIPIVEVEPVRPRAHQIGQRDLYGLVTGSGDQEEDLALFVELRFAVVDVAGRDHRTVPAEQRGPAWKVAFEV